MNAPRTNVITAPITPMVVTPTAAGLFATAIPITLDTRLSSDFSLFSCFSFGFFPGIVVVVFSVVVFSVSGFFILPFWVVVVIWFVVVVGWFVVIMGHNPQSVGQFLQVSPLRHFPSPHAL